METQTKQVEPEQIHTCINYLETIESIIKNSNFANKQTCRNLINKLLIEIKNESDPFMKSLDGRTRNCLHRAGIFHFNDLLYISREDLLNVTHMGETTVKRLEFLAEIVGMKIGSQVIMKGE